MTQQLKDSSHTDDSVEFIYTPTTFKFINDWDHPFILLAGAMNTGKGAASAVKLFKYIFERAPIVRGYRTCTFFGVRSDYSGFRESTLNEIYKWFPPNTVFPPKNKLSSQTTEVRVQVPKTNTTLGIDAKIIFVSLKNFNENDLLSYNVTGMQWSEMQESEEEQVFNTIFDRTGRFPNRDMPKLFFGDINYPDDMHWLYHRFVEDREHTEKVLRYKMYRIPPIIDLNEKGEYVENPKAEIPSHKRNYDYWWSIVNRGNDGEIRRKVIGDFAIVPKGKPVYPAFDDKMIVKKKPILGRRLLFGIDPGNRNHLAVVFGQLDLKGKLRILGALSPESHMDLVTFTEDVLKPYIMSEIYPYLCPDGGKIDTFGWRDPSDPQDRHSNKDTGDIIKELTGINTVKSSTNSIALRTMAVTSRIRRDMLEINESCRVLIKAMKGGYYIDKNGKPDKGRYSHVGNALEYLCYGIDNHMGDFNKTRELESYSSLPPLRS